MRRARAQEYKSILSVGKEDIKNLTKLGLKRGDTVGVHSSLSSFGHLEGSADAVIDALIETVGEQGNTVMSTHSANLSEDKRTQRRKRWAFPGCARFYHTIPIRRQ